MTQIFKKKSPDLEFLKREATTRDTNVTVLQESFTIITSSIFSLYSRYVVGFHIYYLILFIYFLDFVVNINTFAPLAHILNLIKIFSDKMFLCMFSQFIFF